MVDRPLAPLLAQGRLKTICREFTCYWTCTDVGSRTRVEIDHFADPRTLVTTLEDISTLTQPHHPDDWTDIDSAAVDTVLESTTLSDLVHDPAFTLPHEPHLPTGLEPLPLLAHLESR